MAEWRLFDEGTVPECTTAEWYLTREHAPHLEQELHRGRLVKSANLVAQAAAAYGFRTVVDLGAGDGGLLSLLGPAMRSWGYDLAPANVAAAERRRVDVRLADVLSDPIEWADIAVVTEMFEHLIDPHGFAKTVAQNAKALVASSPWIETGDAHYEFHTWAWDLDGYRAMVEQAGWKVLSQERESMFQILLAVTA